MDTKPINIVDLCHFFLNRTKQIRVQAILCLLTEKESKLTTRVLRYFRFRGTLPVQMGYHTYQQCYLEHEALC